MEYQKRVMCRFDKMVEDYGFRVIDASRSIEEIFTDLKDQMSEVLNIGREAPSDPIMSMKPSRNGRATQEIAGNERREIDLRYIGYGRPDNGAALGRD